MKKTFFSSLVFAAFIIFIAQAGAMDFGTAMGIATANIPVGADVAGMGNAWVASPDFSSNNPAVIAVVDEDFRVGSSLTYARIGFKNGPDVNIYAGTVSAKVPFGVLQITYSDANSKTSATAMDVDAKFNSSPSLAILYGAKVAQNLLKDGDELYLGVSYSPIQKSKLTFSSAGENVLCSKSSGYSYGAGALYRPIKEWNIGASYSRSRSKGEENDYAFGETARSVSRTEQIRLGTSVQILPTTLVAVDFQHLNIDGVKKNQVFAGVEQGIIKDLLYVYGGFAGSFKSPTVGVGIYGKSYGLNVAYMHNPFSELKPYLGKSNVAMVSAYISF